MEIHNSITNVPSILYLEPKFETIDCYFISINNLCIFFDSNFKILEFSCSWNDNSNICINSITHKHIAPGIEFFKSADIFRQNLFMEISKHLILSEAECIKNAFIGFDNNKGYPKISGHTLEMYIHKLHSMELSKCESIIFFSDQYSNFTDIYAPKNVIILKQNMLYKLKNCVINVNFKPTGFPYLPNVSFDSLQWWSEKLSTLVTKSNILPKNICLYKQKHILNVSDRVFEIDQNILQKYNFQVIDPMNESKINTLNLIYNSENCILSWGSNHFINLCMNNYNKGNKFLVLCTPGYHAEWINLFEAIKNGIELPNITVINQFNDFIFFIKYCGNYAMLWNTSIGDINHILFFFTNWNPSTI